jgi:hypothetical protein
MLSNEKSSNELISLGMHCVSPVCNSESECHIHMWPTLCSEITLALTVHMQDPPGI